MSTKGGYHTYRNGEKTRRPGSSPPKVLTEGYSVGRSGRIRRRCARVMYVGVLENTTPSAGDTAECVTCRRTSRLPPRSVPVRARSRWPQGACCFMHNLRRAPAFSKTSRPTCQRSVELDVRRVGVPSGELLDVLLLLSPQRRGANAVEARAWWSPRRPCAWTRPSSPWRSIRQWIRVSCSMPSAFSSVCCDAPSMPSASAAGLPPPEALLGPPARRVYDRPNDAPDQVQGGRLRATYLRAPTVSKLADALRRRMTRRSLHTVRGYGRRGAGHLRRLRDWCHRSDESRREASGPHCRAAQQRAVLFA